jgi:hypothetical protein
MNATAYARLFATTVLAASFANASAQGYPGGGGAGGSGRLPHGSSTSLVRPDASAKRVESKLQPHAIGLFAAALERESPSLNLSPAATAAMQEFIRDMKDFAGLDSRHAEQRLGWIQGTVHATVDVGRDLDLARESTHELDGAAADVASDWKKLVTLMDEGQRKRVEAIYGNALLESRRQAAK